MNAWRWGSTALLTLLMLGACRQVIGIEDAEVDPSLNGSSDDAGEQPLDDGSAGTPTAGGGGSDGTDAGSGGMGGTLPLVGTPCERLCATVTQTCVGSFAVYTTRDNCLSVCEQLPLGSEGDTTGNSVECRLHAATQAVIEPSYYCPAAGPGGNGVCGSNCDAWCTLVNGVCAEDLDDGDWETRWQEGATPETSECLRKCAELTDLYTYTVNPSAEMYQGKHVQCRLYHVSVATSGDTEQHCEHALGGPPCD